MCLIKSKSVYLSIQVSFYNFQSTSTGIITMHGATHNDINRMRKICGKGCYEHANCIYPNSHNTKYNHTNAHD